MNVTCSKMFGAIRRKTFRLLGDFCEAGVATTEKVRSGLAAGSVSVWQDFSMDIREALHEVLGGCCLSTKEGLKACVDNLLENLKRYPQDKRSLWRWAPMLVRKGFRS